MTEQEFRQHLTQLGYHGDKVRIVNVEPMSEDDLATCTAKEDECFFNSYMNVIYGKGERYVLGYRGETPPVDHAIIRKGEQYFDPTLQENDPNFAGYQYAILAEFQVFDMMKHAKSNKDFPPDVDYLKKKKKNFKNVIA
ncbi:hypothetical protein [Thaumasiovibrio sp. DFM-14]|uniref:hypothetical protein n=1 Tax=Thaumasiovibrio sp. DFM-14 TaxID=3384792 RepID=UPI00399EFB1B